MDEEWGKKIAGEICEEVELKDTITKAENGGMRLMLSRVMKQLHRSKKPSERLTWRKVVLPFPVPTKQAYLIELTRIPFGPNSWAEVFVIISTAAFDELYNKDN